MENTISKTEFYYLVKTQKGYAVHEYGMELTTTEKWPDATQFGTQENAKYVAENDFNLNPGEYEVQRLTYAFSYTLEPNTN